MKIALFASAFPLSLDADSGFPATFELARAIKSLGHDITVCTIGTPQQPELAEHNVGGLKVISARWDNAARLTCFDGVATFNTFSWQISRARLMHQAFSGFLDEFKPDVIESQEFNGLGFFLVADRKFPVVIRCYGPMSLLMRSGDVGNYPISDVELVEGLELSPVLAADGLISICNDLAQRVSATTGRPVADWDVIRGPFALNADEQAVDEIVEPEQPVMFYWGRVERQKGADLLVDVFASLASKFPRLQLVIAGPETVEQGTSEPYANIMRRRFAELGLSERVKFRGFISREEIRQQVRASTVCVFPSRYETACYAALEAIAYGGVVVATKAGGLPEYHEHGTSAWLVEPQSVEALVEGVTKVLTDEGLRRHLRTNARAFIARACDPQVIAARSIASYEKAIKRFAGRAAREPAAGGTSGEQAFAFLASRLENALAAEPIYSQFPAPPSPSMYNALVHAARRTKGILARKLRAGAG